MKTVERRGALWEVDAPVMLSGYDFWDEWENNAWEQNTLDVVDRLVEPGSEFVDIGAWIGPVSLWASRLAGRVISVEPDPTALRYLAKNIRGNAKNVQVIKGAIDAHTGYTTIAPHPEDGWGSSMTRIATEGKRVPCWTLPDLFDVLDIEGCSLVKMDIEGAESIVLPQIAPFLAQLGIPLLVAMHEPWWNQPLAASWVDSFSHIEGNPRGWEQVLCLP